MYDGSIYDGEWKNDAFHGFGKLTFKNLKKEGEKGIIFFSRNTALSRAHRGAWEALAI